MVRKVLILMAALAICLSAAAQAGAEIPVWTDNLDTLGNWHACDARMGGGSYEVTAITGGVNLHVHSADGTDPSYLAYCSVAIPVVVGNWYRFDAGHRIMQDFGCGMKLASIAYTFDDCATVNAFPDCKWPWDSWYNDSANGGSKWISWSPDFINLSGAFQATGPQVQLILGAEHRCTPEMVNIQYDDARLTAIPEPNCLLALGSGLLGLAGVAIKRRK